MALNFELKKSGFPITIGNIEFFFETSGEKINEYLNRQEKNIVEFEKIEKEVLEVGDLSDFEEENQEQNKDVKMKIDKVISLTKEMARLEYDTLLGDGSFEKIYEEFPDVTELRAVYIAIDDAVSEAIISDASKRADYVTKKRAEILKKKATKRKKSKK